MPKIDFTFTRSVRQTATISVDLSDEDFAKIKNDPRSLKAWAMFGVAVGIPAADWKPLGFSTWQNTPDETFIAMVDGVNLNPIRALSADDVDKALNDPKIVTSPTFPNMPQGWTPGRSIPREVDGFKFWTYRTGINRYTRYCPELSAEVGKSIIGSDAYYVRLNGETVMRAPGKPRRFNSEQTAFKAAVQLRREGK